MSTDTPQEPRPDDLTGFDVDAVAAAARQRDPGLPQETAALLAGQAPAALRALGELDAPGLARALLADNPDVGATACNVVATAAVEFCSAPTVDL